MGEYVKCFFLSDLFFFFFPFKVGDSFYHGKRSAPVDYDMAQKYYKIAAQRNSTKAKVHLARMHHMKQKLLDSNATFLKLLNEASEANSSDATNLLGELKRCLSSH